MFKIRIAKKSSTVRGKVDKLPVDERAEATQPITVMVTPTSIEKENVGVASRRLMQSSKGNYCLNYH